MNHAKQYVSLFIVAVMLAACAATLGKNPETRVFGAKQDYRAALVIANAYAKLPLCKASVPQPCADLDMVRQLQKNQPIVRDALDAAELTVRNPKFAGDMSDKAVVAGEAALGALTSITSRLQADYPSLVPAK